MDEMQQSGKVPDMPLGGDYWEAIPDAPVWGFADLHAHLMAHVAFGGNAFWGLPYDPEHPGAEGIQYALPSCEPIHGGLINVNPEFGHPAGGGWPDFIIWPRFTTLVHQQTYIDWLYRAYQGGLRLVSCLAVNNELLATKSNPRLPTDDRNAIATQLAAMKEMAGFIDEQAGGPGLGWLQIAYSAEEARRIIAENKLAIVLGVEVDSLGNWRRVDDLEAACQGDLTQARLLIGAELDWLYSLGVRQVTPIHLTNNAFGGTAIYMRFLESINVFVTGEHWEVEDAWQTGVRYRLDQDNELIESTERMVAMSGGRKRAMHRHTLVDHIPGARDILEAFEPPNLKGGHANIRSLNTYGVILLEEMMKRGMVIDVDHMSQKSTDMALDMAEASNYPVITSHSWFRDLLYSSPNEFSQEERGYDTSDVHKVAHEAGKRGDQLERIARLGGVVSAILNQGDIARLGQALPELADKVTTPCAGSSTAWAEAYLYAVAKMGGKGVAIGSDINGAAGLPGPRFGTFAAYGARHDARREPSRREEIDQQSNGVAYREPIRDYRWHRFEPTGESGYDEETCDIWHAIAQFVAGFNPANQTHPKNDFPELNIQQLMEAADLYLDQDWIDHITLGFWLADQVPAPDADDISHWPREQRAAYYAHKDLAGGEAVALDDHTQALMEKIKSVWHKWQQMNGDNRPLARSFAGERRDFDINIDGMAHYGMLPDMLQDIRNAGLTAGDLAPLFRSAYDYVQMWQKCEQRAKELGIK
ncbi:MAG TPA: membrane dipeptidase [Anaerolineales bacterium]|nr:membrane dipeptidase [Anaerolineales bacterium]